MAPRYLAVLCRPISNIDGHQHLRSAGRGQLDVPRVRLSTYGGRAFCCVGPTAWNALTDFVKTIHFLCLLLYASLNISTSDFTSTPSAFEVILQYRAIQITYLLTYYGHQPPTTYMHGFNLYFLRYHLVKKLLVSNHLASQSFSHPRS